MTSVFLMRRRRQRRAIQSARSREIFSNDARIVSSTRSTIHKVTRMTRRPFLAIFDCLLLGLVSLRV
jgi:predicted nucleic acid-binding protein